MHSSLELIFFISAINRKLNFLYFVSLLLKFILVVKMFHVFHLVFPSVASRPKLRQTLSLQIFKDCLPQITLGPFLNTLTQISLRDTRNSN